MKTYYDPVGNRWNFSTAARLPKHDLFFGTPENRPTAGIPIGDGDTGSLLWLEKDGVHIHVNKCDLWQDAPAGVTWNDECYCSGHEEELTCVKHAGEIVIKLASPAFDYMYQKAFTARLSLAEAAAYLRSETPFGAVRARAFAENGVTALSCEIVSEEGEAPEITLSRWGSRTLWRWYCQQKFTPDTGLRGTAASAEEKTLYITQELNPTKFCIALRILSAAQAAAGVKNTHTAAAVLNKEKLHRFTLFWTVKTGDTSEEAKRLCRETLDAAENSGEEALFGAHKNEWLSFWNRSFIAIPHDYLENIWYLYLYYMNSESRGAYPPHFTSGLWGFYRDYIPWNYYFHYNEQHMYLPLDAAGHPELAKNYFSLRANGLPKCRLYAQRVKETGGAFLHDVTDRFGRGAEYHYMNCSPGAQVALHMWRHWLFSGDEAFLHETALPFMRESVLFYLDMLKPGADGKLYLQGTSLYESNEVLDDACTDLTMIRALFPRYLPFAEKELRERIVNALARLPEPILLPMEYETDWNGTVFTHGIGKGAEPKGDAMILGVGCRRGKPLRKSFGDPGVPTQIEAFPDVELSPLYPSGLVGLNRRGTPLFNALWNQLMLHRKGNEIGHWNMLPVFLARMGLGKELTEAAGEMLSGFQGFPNGFNAEEGEPGTLRRDAPAFYTVRNTETEEKQLLRSNDFIHFDFETEPIIAMALQESLLQSYEGLLRICPAVSEYPAAFRLYAEGGFRVTAQFEQNGFVLTVESLRGEPCFVVLPPNVPNGAVFARVIKQNGISSPLCIKETVLNNETAFDFSGLNKGETLLLSSEPHTALSTEKQVAAAPNMHMKTCGRAVLGSPPLIG